MSTLNHFKNTPKTSNFTIRADLRALASILKVYKEKAKDTTIITRSELLKVALEHYSSQLIKQYPDCKFELLQDALDYLESYNLDFNRNKNKQNILKELKLENIKFEASNDAFERIKKAKEKL